MFGKIGSNSIIDHNWPPESLSIVPSLWVTLIQGASNTMAVL